MQFPSSSKAVNFNDYQNNGTSASKTKNYYYANNTPQKNKYEYGLFSRRFVPGGNRPNTSNYVNNPLNKSSRYMSQNNSTLNIGGGILNSQQLFSQEMIFLLSDQQNNIRYFKERIDSQRLKIQKEFQNMKQKINHIIEDLKISFQAQLDKSYLNFIAKYRQFKAKMQDLRDVRKALLDDNLAVQAPPNEYLYQLNTTKNISISNRDLLNQIERDAMLFRNNKLFNQISQLQKERIEPAKRVTEQLIALGGIDKEYYKESQTRDLISRLIAIFQRQIQEVYGNILDNYVISTDKMIRIHFETKQQHTMILHGLNEDNKSVNEVNYSRNNYRSLDPKNLNKSNVSYVNKLTSNEGQNNYYYGLSSPRREINQTNNSPKRHQRPASHSIDYLKDGLKSNQKTNRHEDRKISEYQRDRPTSDWKSDYNLNVSNARGNTNEKDQRPISNKGTVNFSLKKIGFEQQTYATEWIEDVKLKEVGCIDAYQTQDAMLCCIFANKGKHIVTGGKDRTVRVYDAVNGKLVCSLQGHKASICSIANHNDFISTGGDNGCSSLIIWQVRTWTIHSKIQAHTAALTSIVDLRDQQHLVTGGYDRKLFIYNYHHGTIVEQIKSNNSPIACMSLTSDGIRLVSTGLDNSVTVWRVLRNGIKPVSLEVEKTFINNALVCSLRCLALRNNLCVLGTKEGKIQVFNLNTGQTIKKLAVSGSSIIELIVFERQSKPDWPFVLSCSAKQKSMVLTKTDTGMNSFIDVKGKLNVDFGCGIGPKVILSQSGHMAVLSQSSNVKQINIYKTTIL